MCDQANLQEGKCRVNGDVCPYLYYCNKIQAYKESSFMPNDKEIPKGMYKVRFERSGSLYVSVDGQIVIVDNPTDHTPMYVKMTKLKSGKWKIKQIMG